MVLDAWVPDLCTRKLTSIQSLSRFLKRKKVTNRIESSKKTTISWEQIDKMPESIRNFFTLQNWKFFRLALSSCFRVWVQIQTDKLSVSLLHCLHKFLNSGTIFLSGWFNASLWPFIPKLHVIIQPRAVNPLLCFYFFHSFFFLWQQTEGCKLRNIYKSNWIIRVHKEIVDNFFFEK